MSAEELVVAWRNSLKIKASAIIGVHLPTTPEEGQSYFLKVYPAGSRLHLNRKLSI